MIVSRTYVLQIPLLLFLIMIRGASTVRILDLKVPTHVPTNSPVSLECHYDLEKEELYSVKWFKNGKEFFRFEKLASGEAVKQGFAQRGLLIDLPKSSDSAVRVTLLNREASGEYKCEVTAEAPSFRVASQFKHVLVVDIPKDGPKIEGARSRYAPGDTIRVNCSSMSLKADANLTWYINGDPVDESHLKLYPVEQNDIGLEEIKLGLEFKVRLKHFRRGDIKLKCVAVIAQLYTSINELSLEGLKIQRAPVLERREIPSSSSASSSLGPSLSATFFIFFLVCKGFVHVPAR